MANNVTNETLQRILTSDVALYFVSIDFDMDVARLFDGKL
jgi:hypothetical protein